MPGKGKAVEKEDVLEKNEKEKNKANSADVNNLDKKQKIIAEKKTQIKNEEKRSFVSLNFDDLETPVLVNNIKIKNNVL